MSTRSKACFHVCITRPKALGAHQRYTLEDGDVVPARTRSKACFQNWLTTARPQQNTQQRVGVGSLFCVVPSPLNFMQMLGNT